MLINADIGEMAGNDADIIPLLDIGNIACGYHASDPDHMAETVRLAICHDVKISAHPSYADKENFGRISHPLSRDRILQLMETQVQLLLGICEEQGTPLYSIKPHGALYHDMMKWSHVRDAIVTIAQKYAVPLIVPAQTGMKEMMEWQTPVIREVFADRGYLPDGSLLPRSQAGSLYLEEETIVAQARKFIQDNEVEPLADTLCFHGDNPASVKSLKTLYAGN